MLQLKFTNDVKVMPVDAEAARCPMVVTAYYWSSQRTFAKFSQSRRRKAPTRAFSFLKVHTKCFHISESMTQSMLRDCENFAKVRCKLCLLLSDTLHWPRRNACRYDLS